MEGGGVGGIGCGGRGMGWEVGADGEREASLSIHWNREAAIVCSLKYRKGHNVLVRLRKALAAVLVCPSGTVHLIVNCYEFT